MTTLEERQQWMRDGCPVELDAMEIIEKCRSFSLQVCLLLPDGSIQAPDAVTGGEIQARCNDCGFFVAVGGIKREDGHVEGVTVCLHQVCLWMDDHGKAKAGTAALVLVGNSYDYRFWSRMRRWAERLMRGESVDERALREGGSMITAGRFEYRLSPVVGVHTAAQKPDTNGDTLPVATGGRIGKRELARMLTGK